MPFYDAIRVGASGAGDFEVERSLRFNDNDSDYLNRTPSSAGNRKTWTWSAWIKRGNIGSRQILFSADNNATHATYFMLELQADDNLRALAGQETGSATLVKETSMVLRDTGAWYHIVFKFDATNATAVFYVNGQEITDYSSTTNPSNQNYQINATTQHFLGRFGSSLGTSYFDGYMAEVNFIDGQALDSSYFGETNPVTGQWNPKKFSGGSYGTNGFYLKFTDNSAATATTLGKDSSGNGNNFTPNNLAVSDSVIDTPTNNFANMTPLNGYTGLSAGNLRFNTYNDSSGPRSTQATIALPKSGKWYWEARYQEAGVSTITTKYFGLSQLQNTNGYLTAPYVYYDGGSGILRNGNASDNKDGKQVWYNGNGVPAILAIAVDVDNNSVEYFHNGNSQGTIPLPTLTSLQEYFFTWANTSGGSSSNLNDTFNFGADSTFQGQTSSGGNTDANGIGDFKYAPPAGHLALCSANLSDPTILLPNKHFEALLYSGNGGTQSITGLQFQPDWVWVKNRVWNK